MQKMVVPYNSNVCENSIVQWNFWIHWLPRENVIAMSPVLVGHNFSNVDILLTFTLCQCNVMTLLNNHSGTGARCGINYKKKWLWQKMSTHSSDYWTSTGKITPADTIHIDRPIWPIGLIDYRDLDTEAAFAASLHPEINWIELNPSLFTSVVFDCCHVTCDISWRHMNFWESHWPLKNNIRGNFEMQSVLSMLWCKIWLWSTPRINKLNEMFFVRVNIC